MKLVTKYFEDKSELNVTIPMHRVVVVDCSGSMSGELPKLRTHLKNKLPTMVSEDDTLTLIWFSSHGQCGTIFENLQISTAQDLQNVHKAIDRFLVPTGLTGFKEPLDKVLSLATTSDKPVAMVFMSDGFLNSGPGKNEIIKVCATLADNVATSCVVSYGYYADDRFLTEMAEEMGGEMIGAGDFQSYTDVLSRLLNTRASNKRKVVDGLPKDTFIVGHLEESFVTVKPDASGKGVFPSNCIAYSYYVQGDGVEDAYAAVQVAGALIQRGQSDEALQLAEEIGDVELFNIIQNAFSKQDFNRVVSFVGKHLAYSQSPKNEKLKTDPNAYNVLTLLMDLADTEGNKLNIGHEDFKYTAIGQKRETEAVDGFIPEFTATKGGIVEISTLKFDEDRPNVSILTRRDGTVSLPDNDFGFGNSVESFIWRNYAIIRDGIVNVKKLPVILTKATHDLLSANGIPLAPFKINQTYVIDVSNMPVINRSMATPITAAEIAQMELSLFKLRVTQKILNSRIEKPEVNQEFAAKYGEEAAQFLAKYGVKPGGFGPKTVAGDNPDPYTAKALEVKISGLSSVPKIADVEADIVAGKNLTPSKVLVSQALDALKGVTDNESALSALKKNLATQRDLMIKAKFGIILGRRWFTDLGSYDNTEIEITVPGITKKLKVSFNLVDKEV